MNASLQLDRQTPVPIWYQLFRLLQLRISSGQLKPHQPVGTEEALVAEYQVARSTVRRALDELQRDGWLERHGPRRPLVVRDRPVAQEAGRLVGLFSEGFVSRGVEMAITVLDAATVNDPNTALRLQLKPSAPLIRVARIFSADGNAAALETAWLPKAIFPSLLRHDLSQQLTALVETEFGITYSTARQTLRSRLATAEECALLELIPPVAVIYISRLSLDQHGRPIEYMESVMRSDRYELVMDLHVDGDRA